MFPFWSSAVWGASHNILVFCCHNKVYSCPVSPVKRHVFEHRETAAAAAQRCSHGSYQNNGEAYSDQQCLKILLLLSTDKHLMGANFKFKFHLSCLSGRKQIKTTVIICHYNTSVSSDDGFTQLTHTHTQIQRPASISPPPEDSLTSPCLAA